MNLRNSGRLYRVNGDKLEVLTRMPGSAGLEKRIQRSIWGTGSAWEEAALLSGAAIGQETEYELRFSPLHMYLTDSQPIPRIHWIQPVQQERSRQTLERLLDSAEALIANKGFGDVTVADIAARAGVSVGAVYSRFHDKMGVLHCLQDRFVESAHLTTDVAFDPDRWDGASVEEIVSEVVVFLVEIHRERRGVLRELIVGTRSEPPMVERKERLVAHVTRRLCELLLPRSERIRHPDPAAAVSFGLRLVLGTLEQAILFGEGGIYGIPASDESLAAELTRAFLGYLSVDERPRGVT